MTPQSAPGPLLVFDFDGVLVDGMPEYWWAARSAALRLEPTLELPADIPAAFARLRPLIHKGWEMVLVAAELGRAGAEGGAPDWPSADPRTAEHPGDCLSVARDYAAALEPALRRRGWTAATLQAVLEQVRSEAVAKQRQAWLGRHRFYPGVVERLGRLAAEGADWGVLTTKGGAFAAEILAAAGLHPRFLHGHEQGSKPEVLLQLSRQGRSLWFIEDRRPTLEAVLATPGLEAVRCFLAAWGYLAAGDRDALAGSPIRWLTPGGFAAPLAEWP